VQAVRAAMPVDEGAGAFAAAPLLLETLIGA
jgi:hypothetical protein